MLELYETLKKRMRYLALGFPMKDDVMGWVNWSVAAYALALQLASYDGELDQDEIDEIETLARRST